MPLQVKCLNPDCGSVSVVDDNSVGGNTRCSACETTFHVAAPPAVDRVTKTTLRPSAAANPTVLAPSPDVAADPPQRIGRFELRARLGAGAFGVVYRAYDPQHQCEVALKVLHPEMLNKPERFERFQREARVAAQLRHPNIVPVSETGQEGDQCYLVAAYVKGQTLREALDRKPMKHERAARIVCALAEAVAYAHRQGVVHRDLKSANVLLDENDTPQLLDFGLAGYLEPARHEPAHHLTRLGAVLGTPGYMAPERALGHTGEVLPSADQYSLGVMLYELLCGRPPFEGPPGLVLYNVINTTPATLRSLNPDVPPELERICQKAMARRPEDRYADCQALADDLQRWLGGGKPAKTPVAVVARDETRGSPVIRAESLVPRAGRIALGAVAKLYSEIPFRRSKEGKNLDANGFSLPGVKTVQLLPSKAALITAAGVMAACILLVVAIAGVGLWWTMQKPVAATQKQLTATQQAAAQEKVERQRKLDQEAAERQAAQEKAAREAAEVARRQKYQDGLASIRNALKKNDHEQALELLNQQPLDLRDNDWQVLATAQQKAAGAVAEAAKYPKTMTVDLGGGVNMEFVLLNAQGNDTFQMGATANDSNPSTDEKPQHKVTLTKPFYSAKYPVTQEQYAKLTSKTPSYFRKGDAGDARLSDVKDKDPGQFPVEYVSWEDADAFCKTLMDKHGTQTPAALRQLKYRFALPTEAQWEYACRAGTSTVYYFGNDAKDLGEYAWFFENSGSRTHEVGTRKPNKWGLYDMHGNVYQWCQDYYDSSYYASGDNKDTLNLKGSSRVRRGGSWDVRARDCHAADRSYNAPVNRNVNVGFRVSFRLD